MEAQNQEVTQLLLAWSNGESAALNRLMPLVYDHLHRLARFYMRGEPPDHSLQATGLIHEAYLKLVDQKRAQWHNRAHFYAVSAQLMRRILVDIARSRQARRHGGALKRLSLDEAPEIAATDSDELIVPAQFDSQRQRDLRRVLSGDDSIKRCCETACTYIVGWNGFCSDLVYRG